MSTQAPYIRDASPPVWLTVMAAVLGIVFGLLLILAPEASSVVLVQILGIYLLIVGMIDFVSIAWDRTRWAWKVLSGIVGVIAGLAVVRHPLWSTVLVGTTLVTFIAIMAIVYGAIAVASGYRARAWGAIILGVFEVVIGLVLLFNPLAGAIGLPLLIGILLVIGGIAALAAAVWRGAGGGGPSGSGRVGVAS
jgi:uncharacterized membrane protein HdeD (DUF308 family)